MQAVVLGLAVEVESVEDIFDDLEMEGQVRRLALLIVWIQRTELGDQVNE